MAVVALKCPSCSGEIELDDSKEFGFCMFCGTKVMIQEEVQKIKIEHSGSVALDESKKMNNYMTLADSAVKNGNFEEAYSYYTKVLECDVGSWQAVFRKGLSAAYLSSLDNNRTSELFNAAEAARSLVAGTENMVGACKNIQHDTVLFTDNFFKSCIENVISEKFPSGDAANRYFTAVERLCALRLYALEMLDMSVVGEDPELEDYYRKVIDDTLLIGAKTQKNATYLVGYQSVKEKSGEVRQEPVYKKLAPVYDKEMKTYTARLKEMYNNLPSTVRKIAEYDADMAQRQASIDDYEASLKSFFLANPEDEKTYRHPGLFGAKKKRGAIEEKFSEELLAKKALSEKCEGELSALTKEKKKFIAANTKK